MREKVEERARAFVFDGFQTSIIPGAAAALRLRFVCFSALSLNLSRTFAFCFPPGKKEKKKATTSITETNKQKKKLTN